MTVTSVLCFNRQLNCNRELYSTVQNEKVCFGSSCGSTTKGSCQYKILPKYCFAAMQSLSLPQVSELFIYLTGFAQNTVSTIANVMSQHRRYLMKAHVYRKLSCSPISIACESTDARKNSPKSRTFNEGRNTNFNACLDTQSHKFRLYMCQLVMWNFWKSYPKTLGNVFASMVAVILGATKNTWQNGEARMKGTIIQYSSIVHNFTAFDITLA